MTSSRQDVNSVSICARAQQGVVFELTSSSDEMRSHCLLARSLVLVLSVFKWTAEGKL